MVNYWTRKPSLAFQFVILGRRANGSCHSFVISLRNSYVWDSPSCLRPRTGCIRCSGSEQVLRFESGDLLSFCYEAKEAASLVGRFAVECIGPSASGAEAPGGRTWSTLSI